MHDGVVSGAGNVVCTTSATLLVSEGSAGEARERTEAGWKS